MFNTIKDFLGLAIHFADTAKQKMEAEKFPRADEIEAIVKGLKELLDKAVSHQQQVQAERERNAHTASAATAEALEDVNLANRNDVIAAMRSA